MCVVKDQEAHEEQVEAFAKTTPQELGIEEHMGGTPFTREEKGRETEKVKGHDVEEHVALEGTRPEVHYAKDGIHYHKKASYEIHQSAYSNEETFATSYEVFAIVSGCFTSLYH